MFVPWVKDNRPILPVGFYNRCFHQHRPQTHYREQHGLKDKQKRGMLSSVYTWALNNLTTVSKFLTCHKPNWLSGVITPSNYLFWNESRATSSGWKLSQMHSVSAWFNWSILTFALCCHELCHSSRDLGDHGGLSLSWHTGAVGQVTLCACRAAVDVIWTTDGLEENNKGSVSIYWGWIHAFDSHWFFRPVTSGTVFQFKYFNLYRSYLFFHKCIAH